MEAQTVTWMLSLVLLVDCAKAECLEVHNGHGIKHKLFWKWPEGIKGGFLLVRKASLWVE